MRNSYNLFLHQKERKKLPDLSVDMKESVQLGAASRTPAGRLFHSPKHCLRDISSRVPSVWTTCWLNINLRDIRLAQWYKWDLRSSGMLISVGWQLITDVSPQPIGHFFKGQIVQDGSWTTWPLKVGPIGCPETSVINCQPTLSNIPEDRKSKYQLTMEDTVPHSSLTYVMLARFTICTVQKY